MRHVVLGVLLSVAIHGHLVARSPQGAAAPYSATEHADIVTLRDARADITVSVLAPTSNAFDIVVKGQHILRRNYASLDALRQTPGLNGIPLLWPYANRLDEQAFYANGTKYSFDTGLGNTGRGAIPIHGFVTNTKEWKVVEVRADATAAWVTSRLEFYRNPRYMKQFPFAHVVTMTYHLSGGQLEVRTAIENLSAEPMPVALGFHPYFQLTDAPRDDWTLSIGARTHWLLNANTIPTGETQPITALLPDPPNVGVREFPSLDDVFTDLERGGDGRATMSVRGRDQSIDVVLGPNFKAVLILTRTGGRGRGAAAPSPAGSGPASPVIGSVAIEPMAGVSNSMNLAERGLYKELQSIPPGGTWQESFWIRPTGF